MRLHAAIIQGAIALLLSTLVGACQSQSQPTRGTKTLEQHGEELKKQHQMEMENRSPSARP